MPKGIFKNPIERAKKISEAQKGRKFSEKHKINLGISVKNSYNEELRTKRRSHFQKLKDLGILVIHRGENHHNYNRKVCVAHVLSPRYVANAASRASVVGS